MSVRQSGDDREMLRNSQSELDRLGVRNFENKPQSLLTKMNSVKSSETTLLHENRVAKYRGSVNKQGQRHGYGKEYHDNGFLVYSGYFEEDGFHGSDCKIYDSRRKLVYSGGYKCGLMHGRGEVYHGNGQIRFQGTYKDGVMSGAEVVTYNSEGGVVNIGSIDGLVKIFWSENIGEGWQLRRVC
jgi:antitoxin component YwqK of YwqJK toxin-antitoxin module